MAKSKMYAGITLLLELVKEGAYTVQNGELYNAKGSKVGKIGADSKQVFYTVRGYHLQASRFYYAYYNGGVDALKDGEGIYYLDGNKLNNVEGNLVQLPKRGAKAALVKLRKDMSCSLPLAVQPLADNAEDKAETLPPEEVAKALLAEGKSVKEVAAITGLKYKKAWDINRKLNDK